MQELLTASHAAPTGKATLSLPLFDRNSTLYRPRTRLPCAMDPLASRGPCNHHTEVGLEAKSWSSLVWCAKFGVLRARRYEVQIHSFFLVVVNILTTSPSRPSCQAVFRSALWKSGSSTPRPSRKPRAPPLSLDQNSDSPVAWPPMFVAAG